MHIVKQDMLPIFPNRAEIAVLFILLALTNLEILQ